MLLRGESDSIETVSPVSEYPLLVANELEAETADVGIVSSSLESSDISNRSLIQEPCQLFDALLDMVAGPSSGLAIASVGVIMDNGGDNGAST
jgi:hypothetical protein